MTEYQQFFADQDEVAAWADAERARRKDEALEHAPLPPAKKEETTTYTLEEVSAFLCGEAPLAGVWFGARLEGERGVFWWRRHLRAAVASVKAIPVRTTPEYVAGAAEFLYPSAGDPVPPGGAKVQLLTVGGICVHGTWNDSGAYLGWCPLPKRNKEKEACASTEPLANSTAAQKSPIGTALWPTPASAAKRCK